MKRIILLITAVLIGFTTNAQEKRMAVVQTSTCYMRLQPDYEAALETQELMGTVVEVVGSSRYWRQIVCPQPYKAWTTSMTIVEMTGEQIEEYEKAPKYIYTAEYGHLFTKPDINSNRICDLVGGDVLRVVEKPVKEKSKTERLIEELGVRLAGLKNEICPPITAPEKQEIWVEAMLPSGKTGWIKANDVRLLGERINAEMGKDIQGCISPEKIEGAIAQAQKMVGVPYLWGGMSSKGVDCSGLVRICFLMNDVLLPRNASQQIKCGQRIELPLKDIKDGYDVETAQKATEGLKRGDLVFFGKIDEMRVSHVALYLGDGKIIHSSHLVRINSLIPGENDYYEGAGKLIGACRLSY